MGTTNPHLPLARQSRRMKDYGLNVTSQTLWDYTDAGAKWFLPTDDALPLKVFSQHALAQCWVLARRNYIKAVRGDPHVEERLLLIGRLYRLKRAYSPE